MGNTWILTEIFCNFVIFYILQSIYFARIFCLFVYWKTFSFVFGAKCNSVQSRSGDRHGRDRILYFFAFKSSEVVLQFVSPAAPSNTIHSSAAWMGADIYNHKCREPPFSGLSWTPFFFLSEWPMLLVWYSSHFLMELFYICSLRIICTESSFKSHSNLLPNGNATLWITFTFIDEASKAKERAAFDYIISYEKVGSSEIVLKILKFLDPSSNWDVKTLT